MTNCSALTVSLLAAATLMACGGDSGSDVAAPTPPPPPPATRLVGVAAIGAPMSGAAITVIDVDAATADATATASSDGSYSVDVTSVRAPFLVRAAATVNGEAVTHVSLNPAVNPSQATHLGA